MSKVGARLESSSRSSRARPPTSMPASRDQVAVQQDRIRAALGTTEAPGPVLRRRPAGPGAAPGAEDASLLERIQARAHQGTRLPEPVRASLEPGLGSSLSSVRLHVDPEADRLAREVDALAFTAGDHIFFRAGAYAPDSREGLRLLAHEAAHTTQRVETAGLAPGEVRLSQPSEPLERAADVAASRALGGDELRPMLLRFPQAERARLHPPAWKQVFLWVCDDDTIAQAVVDLGLEAATAQAWIAEERSW